MASKYDNKNIYHLEIEAEESVISMRHRVFKINEKILKGGAKYKHIEPSLRYMHLEKRDG